MARGNYCVTRRGVGDVRYSRFRDTGITRTRSGVGVGFPRRAVQRAVLGQLKAFFSRASCDSSADSSLWASAMRLS